LQCFGAELLQQPGARSDLYSFKNLASIREEIGKLALLDPGVVKFNKGET